MTERSVTFARQRAHSVERRAGLSEPMTRAACGLPPRSIKGVALTAPFRVTPESLAQGRLVLRHVSPDAKAIDLENVRQRYWNDSLALGPRAVPWRTQDFEAAKQIVDQMVSPDEILVITNRLFKWSSAFSVLGSNAEEALNRYNSTMDSQKARDAGFRDIKINLFLSGLQIALSALGAAPLVSVIGTILTNDQVSKPIIAGVGALIGWTINAAPNALSAQLMQHFRLRIQSRFAPDRLGGFSVGALRMGFAESFSELSDQALQIIRDVHGSYSSDAQLEALLWALHIEYSDGSPRSAMDGDLITALREYRDATRDSIKSNINEIFGKPFAFTQDNDVEIANVFEKTFWALHLRMLRNQKIPNQLDGPLGILVAQRLQTLGIVTISDRNTICGILGRAKDKLSSELHHKPEPPRRIIARNVEPAPDAIVIGKSKLDAATQKKLLDWSTAYLVQNPFGPVFAGRQTTGAHRGESSFTQAIPADVMKQFDSMSPRK